MKFMSFTSGSCGNCYYLGTETKDGKQAEGILIDAGASMRRVKRIMQDNKLALDKVHGILVTHDHLDHIRFLGTFCKYLRPKVYATKKLHGALATHSFTKDHIAGCRSVLADNQWNKVGSFEVRYFVVPHDATQTVGYAVRHDGHLFVLMTDLEHVTPEAMELAKQADTVVIESNYDYDMLINGPYPPELKERILNEGHLCNRDTADAIKEFYHPELKNLFLCHLSGNNNTPDIAYKNALAALEEVGVAKGVVHLRTLDRGVPSPLITL